MNLTISQQAGQPPSLRGSWIKHSLDKMTGSARLKGGGNAKHNTDRKEKTYTKYTSPVVWIAPTKQKRERRGYRLEVELTSGKRTGKAYLSP